MSAVISALLFGDNQVSLRAVLSRLYNVVVHELYFISSCSCIQQGKLSVQGYCYVSRIHCSTIDVYAIVHVADRCTCLACVVIAC